MTSLPWTHVAFWAAAVACAVAQVAIVRSVLVARAPVAGDGHANDGEDTSRVPVARRAGEVAWAVVPALALAVVLVLTWQAVRA